MMITATYIRILIGYIKDGLILLFVIVCILLYVDLLRDIEKPALQDFTTDEAFDPITVETLHPDSAINRKANA